MIRTTVTVNGTLQGGLWWPYGHPAQVNVHAAESVDRYTAPPTLRDIIDTIIAEHGGDFSDAPRLTADSTVTIVRERSGRTAHTAQRTYTVDALPSIADYVDVDAFTFGEDYE